MALTKINRTQNLLESNKVIDSSTALIATTATGTPAAGYFHSTIVGRKPLPRLDKDSKVRMGVERIMTQQVFQLQDEFGPNGESVFGVLNDSLGQIRLVGNIQSYQDTTGTGTNPMDTASYIEITFYGTGLNGLMYLFGAANTTVYSVNGGSSSAFVSQVASTSNILNGRNYSSNQVVPIVSGLALGIHTVKIQTTVQAGIPKYYGFEILNQSSQLKVTPGYAYEAGMILNPSATEQSLAYNSGFESGTLGTRGGRVVVYQKTDGTVAKAVTPVNASTQTLNAADHTNEEILRTYFPSEFGAGRTDDWSLNTGSIARAFTLEDGTTSLTTSQSQIGPMPGSSPTEYGIYFGSTHTYTLTFVGTGIDIELITGSAEAATYTAYIDGTSIGNIPYTVPSSGVRKRTYKIASGLPYGTHTFRIHVSAGSPTQIVLTKFITYSAKKPSIPSGAIELADYNVMADYVGGGTSNNTLQFAQGSLFKSCVREFVYTAGTGGTWAVVVSPSDWGGFAIQNTDTGGSPSASYTFFGIGLEIPSFAVTSNQTFTVQIDGVNYAGTAAAVGASSWSSPTWTVNANGGGVLRITGLTLGLHTVKLIRTSTANSSYLYGMAVITPIHAPKSNLYGDLQNTLTVGSNSIADTRKFGKSLETKKAWAQAVGVTSTVTTTSVTPNFVPVPDMSVTIKTSGGPLLVGFDGAIRNSALGNSTYFKIYVDGVAQEPLMDLLAQVANGELTQSFTRMVNVGPGTHKIDIYWCVNAGTALLFQNYRNMFVREL